jgi:hypothetical protein
MNILLGVFFLIGGLAVAVFFKDCLTSRAQKGSSRSGRDPENRAEH